MTTSRETLRLLGLRDAALSVDEVLGAVTDAAAGGTALFVGTVRAEDGGREVVGLEYSAHPTAAAELARVAAEVADDDDVVALAAVHRVGSLVVGDLAIVAAVACAHRGEAFAAARRLVDAIKHEVPIWKHQTFADGTQEWVGAGC